MGVQFNAKEVFEFAQQIERNGKIYYEKAAELSSNPQVKKEFLELAAMEANHEITFREMVGEPLDKSGTFYDPTEEALAYLKEFVEGSVFQIEGIPADFVTSERSVTDILKYAIQLEKNSVVFYLALKDSVSKELGKARLEEIINEEMKHIILLNKRIKALSA